MPIAKVGQSPIESYEIHDSTPLPTSGAPFYPAPQESRPPGVVLRSNIHPSPESNENPVLALPYSRFPDHLYTGEAEGTRPARRGYIAYFLNPAQFWQGDELGGARAGKLITGKQSATTMPGGMMPDTAQRANIPQTPVSSYGDLVTQTTDMLGIAPVSGW